LQQKQTQLILHPQYVLSKEKMPRRIPLGERLEKYPNSFSFSREKGKKKLKLFVNMDKRCII